MFFIFLLSLTVLCGILLVIGFIWLLASSGQTRRRSGAEVGAEIHAESMADEDEPTWEGSWSTFHGKASSVSIEASSSYADIKHMLKARQWRSAAPFLLAGIGLIGLLVFGSMALVLGMTEKWVAIFLFLVVVFTVSRIISSFITA
jgi:uncharacterized membrane protein YphA (DoxX/SURF4 family)